MNLNHLHYFRVLAKTEHYTQAAKELSITQPSLSHAISTLEKDLGTYLFEKQGRNIRLTKYGLFFLGYVENALNELEIGEKKLRGLTSSSTGTIDLGFIYTLGSHIMPNLMKDFLSNEEYKNISFSLFQGTTKKIIEGLKSEKFDLGFCSFMENEDDIDFIPILEEELVLVVSKNHELASQDTVDLKYLEKYPFIFFNKESGMRPHIDNLFNKVNITPKVICEVEEDSAILGLVSINYGIAIVPNIYLIKNFDVKVLHITNPLIKRYIYMASVKNKYISPSASSFRSFIISNTNNEL
ncbi:MULTISPECIES: LysR family transcriptional regulator [Clostridium]|uniref:LysR family transcriptional regulator n=1 Tax=Clostridium cibarium TaxID=2762247 RepID=A0ABR8PQZ9_9CLOT|nr:MULTISPECIES: LysR family transcriptional regulator [Clostridium]MBD7910606.1 LysR family transcriptional regulator [Clostridium cibarium]